MPNQQCQSTKGSASILKVQFNFDILIFCITTASTYKIQYGDGVSNTVEENWAGMQVVKFYTNKISSSLKGHSGAD